MAANIKAGCRPVIITVFDRVRSALDQIAEAGLENRVIVWDVQQFLSTNIFEHSLFVASEQTKVLQKLIDRYNAIIDQVEDDPSLHIEIGGE